MSERTVSVVIPARNEERHIDACIRSVLAQELDRPFEVIVADGCSEDRTAEVAARAGVTVLANRRRAIPSALNLGLATAHGDVLVRFDAHAEMPAGYLQACIDALAGEPASVNVGGWRKVRPDGPWGRALGAALSSRLGVGNARIWRVPAAADAHRDADTVPLGCFRVGDLRAAGGWREDLLANEDFELNDRLRRRGGRVVFAPEIWSIYRPPETFPAILRQYFRYGRWKAVVLRNEPRSLRPRQLAPLALLATGVAAPRHRPARLALGAYGVLLATVALRARSGWRTAPVLAGMHLAWGSGLVCGAVRAMGRAR